MQHNFILYQPSLTHPLFECIPSDTLLYTNNLELPGTNSAMSLESLDRSSNHKATPTRIKKDVDPFNSSLLAAPGLSPKDEHLQPLTEELDSSCHLGLLRAAGITESTSADSALDEHRV